MSKFRAKIAVALGSALLAVAAFEGGARAVAALDGRAYVAARARAEVVAIASAAVENVPRPGGAGEGVQGLAVDREVLHPYFAFAGADWHERLDEQLEVMARKRGDDFSILVMGGSVAAIFANLGGDRMVEALLADARFAGRRVKLLSVARGAYKQPQQVAVANYLFSVGVRPDLVVNIDGFNEVAIGGGNGLVGLHPMQPSPGQWLPVTGAREAGSVDFEQVGAFYAARQRLVDACEDVLGGHAWRSALTGPRAIVRLRRMQAELNGHSQALLESFTSKALDSHLRGPTIVREAAMNVALRAWIEGSRSLAAICRARGVEYVHVLQPTLHDPGAKPATADEVRTGKIADHWLEGVEQGYPLLREAGAGLANEGIAFLDASRLFAEDERTLYYDFCHFGEIGNDLLADAIATFVLARMPE